MLVVTRGIQGREAMVIQGVDLGAGFDQQAGHFDAAQGGGAAPKRFSASVPPRSTTSSAPSGMPDFAGPPKLATNDQPHPAPPGAPCHLAARPVRSYTERAWTEDRATQRCDPSADCFEPHVDVLLTCGVFTILDTFSTP